jgi:GAF domain-containing protein
LPLGAEDTDALTAGAAVSPGALFAAILHVARQRLDATLVTVMRHHAAEAEVERLYSSDELTYPVGGRKHKRDTTWSRRVLVKHEVVVSSGDDALREAFDDHATIFGLGVHSIVNVPLVSEGRCVGTLNISRAKADWSDDDVALARALGLAALAGVLMI